MPEEREISRLWQKVDSWERKLSEQKELTQQAKNLAERHIDACTIRAEQVEKQLTRICKTLENTNSDIIEIKNEVTEIKAKESMIRGGWWVFSGGLVLLAFILQVLSDWLKP